MQNSVGLNEIWQEMLEFFAQDPEIGQVKVSLWISRVRPVSLENNALLLEVPNEMFRIKIQSRFEKKITSFFKDILCLDEDIKVSYSTAGSTRAEQKKSETEAVPGKKENIVPSNTGNIPPIMAERENIDNIDGLIAIPTQNPRTGLEAAKNAQDSLFSNAGHNDVHQLNNGENIRMAPWQPEIDRKKALDISKTNPGLTGQPYVNYNVNKTKTNLYTGKLEDDISTAPWQPEIDRKKALENLSASQPAETENPFALHPMFNPEYTFENFIRSTSNEFAFTLALSVVSSKKSPVFIYSKPGLGKTHLLHAIAHGLYRKNKKVKVILKTAESFANEYIKDIQNRTTDEFRERYRNLDCLLLDDVQFLLKAERSREEFFHTFNTIFDLHSIIVITSDRSPAEMKLDDRLLSRFMAGFVADIKMPDYETRVSIMQKKNDFSGYGIPYDVINFIAEKVHNGGRELGGCLMTLSGFCMQTGAKPTIDLAKELLKSFFSSPPEDQPISIRTIIKVVADEYSVDARDIIGNSRDQEIVMPRHIAMYLAAKMTGMTQTKISEAFGKKAHTSVISAENKVEELIKNPFFNEVINRIIKKIKDVNNFD